MFSNSSLVKLIVFQKQKTGKTNKNIRNTDEQSTVAAMSGAILDLLREIENVLQENAKFLGRTIFLMWKKANVSKKNPKSLLRECNTFPKQCKCFARKGKVYLMFCAIAKFLG